MKKSFFVAAGAAVCCLLFVLAACEAPLNRVADRVGDNDMVTSPSPGPQDITWEAEVVGPALQFNFSSPVNLTADNVSLTAVTPPYRVQRGGMSPFDGGRSWMVTLSSEEPVDLMIAVVHSRVQFRWLTMRFGGGESGNPGPGGPGGGNPGSGSGITWTAALTEFSGSEFIEFTFASDPGVVNRNNVVFTRQSQAGQLEFLDGPLLGTGSTRLLEISRLERPVAGDFLISREGIHPGPHSVSIGSTGPGGPTEPGGPPPPADITWSVTAITRSHIHFTFSADPQQLIRDDFFIFMTTGGVTLGEFLWIGPLQRNLQIEYINPPVSFQFQFVKPGIDSRWTVIDIR